MPLPSGKATAGLSLIKGQLRKGNLQALSAGRFCDIMRLGLERLRRGRRVFDGENQSLWVVLLASDGLMFFHRGRCTEPLRLAATQQACCFG